MRLLLIGGLAAMLAACGGETTSTTAPAAQPVSALTEAVAEDTRVAAVLIRADWCSSCKIIEPKLDAIKAAGAIDGLQHVTLDYTDRNKEAFYANADTIGVAEAVNAYLEGDVTTGVVLLVDMDKNSVVVDLRKELSEDELKQAMVEAAA